MPGDQLGNQLIKLPLPLNTNTNWDIAFASSSSSSSSPSSSPSSSSSSYHQHCRTKPSVVRAQNVWLIPLRSLSRTPLLAVSLSQLGMFCFPTRLQPALELTTQNQQQLWKSCFRCETIHFEFLQRAMSLDVSS